MDLICTLCTGRHHAVQCPTARSTLLAAGSTPGRPPVQDRVPAYRTDPVVPGRFTAAIAADIRRRWYEARGLQPQTMTYSEANRIAGGGVGWRRPRGPDGRFQPRRRDTVSTG